MAGLILWLVVEVTLQETLSNTFATFQRGGAGFSHSRSRSRRTQSRGGMAGLILWLVGEVMLQDLKAASPEPSRLLVTKMATMLQF